MDHMPLSMELEGSNSDTEHNGHSASKVPKTPFRLLVACVVVGTVGLAGISHFGLPLTGASPQQPLSPLMHYSTVMKKFGARVLSAIHDPSKMNKISMAHYNKFVNKFTARMLSETSKFETNGEIVVRQKGSTLPNAMNILLQSKKQKPGQGPTTLKVTAIAKPGRQAALEATLGKLTEMEKTIKATKQGTDAVLLVIPMPPNGPGKQAEGDMEEGLKLPDTNVLVDLTLGATLDDLHKNRDTNIFEALNGMHLKSKASVAAKLVDAAVEAMEGGEEVLSPDTTDEVAAKDFAKAKLLEAFAEVNVNTEFLYRPKSERGDLFGNAATVEFFLNEMKMKLKTQPPPLIAFVKEVSASCDGISSFEISGGDVPIEFVVTFQNFKPMKLVTDLANEMDKEA
jgi:hypothetical protein